MDYGFQSLKDKNVLITGGSGAIGYAIAKGFQSCGSHVTLWGHRETEWKAEFESYQVVELSDVEEVKKEYLRLRKEIDILVNCAGFTCGAASEEYPYELWDKTLAVNLTAPFLLCQLAGRDMIKRGKGSIINITSIGAELGFPGNPAYGASKGGLKQLTKALACDWAQYGVRVNNIGPGYTRTKMTGASWKDEEKRQERTGRMMIKRWASPEDIVGTVLFLGSDLSEYITGQDIYVDGGWTAKGM